MRNAIAASLIFLAGCSHDTPPDVPEEQALPRTVGEIMEGAPADAWRTPDPENLVYMDVPGGRIIIELSPDLAPHHVAQMKTLVREGYYDGLDFYRVVHGFVAQGGDESGDKSKGSAEPILAAEFEEPWRDDLAWMEHPYKDGYADRVGYLNGFPAGRDMDDGTVWLTHCTGAFAFGRDNEADTASTEFYIPLQPQRYLDRNLTVFGRVLVGMDVVQAMKRGQFGSGGVIENKDDWTPILKVQMAADVPEAERVPVQVMDTNSETFRELIGARAARSSEFFHFQHWYVDLCQMPIPVRLVTE